MTAQHRAPAPLSLKPDLEDADRRWRAFYAGDLIGRPVVCVTAPRSDAPLPAMSTYHDRVFGDLDDCIDRDLARAEGTAWLGEAVPAWFPSFGPDEIAAFTGADLGWTDDSDVTNWSIPYVDDWADTPPLTLKDDNPLWQRMLKLCRRAAERFEGKMLLTSLDLHTNMDLLAAVRGPQRLCTDLLDCPEEIDRRMVEARAIFRPLWDAIARAGRMDERGYCYGLYSMEGTAVLQCDFSCMVGPEMFRRWILPALEEEARIVGHARYHWDGPGALVHADDLIASEGLHSLDYVPGAGRGEHVDYIDLYQRIQAGGKAVSVHGSPDQLKVMHRQLRPDKTLYSTTAASPAEAEALLEWFVQNT